MSEPKTEDAPERMGEGRFDELFAMFTTAGNLFGVAEGQEVFDELRCERARADECLSDAMNLVTYWRKRTDLLVTRAVRAEAASEMLSRVEHELSCAFLTFWADHDQDECPEPACGVCVACSVLAAVRDHLDPREGGGG